LQGVEKDYGEMVNSLLDENKKLEELLKLMACHLDNLASNYPGRDLEGSDAAAAAADATSQLSSRLEEWQRQSIQTREFQQEKVLLQKRLCEEEMSGQELRQQLDALMGTTTEPASFDLSDIAEDTGTAALVSRLQAAEEARLQETCGRELAEARCALMEQRCRDAVARLEAELVEARSGKTDLNERKGPNANGDSPLKEEVQALTQQMDFEQKVHDHRRALLERYKLPGKVELIEERPQEPKLEATKRPARSDEMPRSTTVTDDEDYNWEGYVERPIGDSFEKVFLEIRNGQFKVLHNRGSQSLLSGYPLSSLAGAAAITNRCSRSFEVEWSGKTECFRCVSERRAAQWVEAINSAWQHAGPKNRIIGRRVKA